MTEIARISAGCLDFHLDKTDRRTFVKSVMEDIHKIGKSWAIGTFVRILPNVKNSNNLVQYAVEGMPVEGTTLTFSTVK